MKYFRVPLLALFFAGVCSLSAAPRQLLSGHVPAATARAALIGPLSPGKELDLVISLPLRNREGLTNFLGQITDPASPNFHHYLTPPQFTTQFGPSEADYHAVIDFARAQGLEVTRTNANRTLVDVRASVATINKAFHLTLLEYQHPTESRTFFAPNAEPSLDLSTPVLHVSGLDNFSPPRPALKLKPHDGGAQPSAANGSGPNALYIGRDFRNAYIPNVTLNGAGQSVALVEFNGYYPQDIAAYESLAGLPATPLTNVLINSTGVVTDQNGNAEVSLDIEMAISMATNLASVMIYEGGVNSTAAEILNQMAVDDKALQIGCSWGGSTFADPSVTQSLQQFAAQGQSFFEAAGDNDAYNASSVAIAPQDSPYVTSVGGTSLSMSGSGGAYLSETVWNRGAGVGTGGGVSSTYLIPDWQTNVNMAANQGSTTHRNVPDVAMVADDIFLLYNQGQQTAVGGTSCATPLWATFTALANELAASNGVSPVGFINPALYAIAEGPQYSSLFHDITSGNNESPTSPTHFVAAPGFDLCTGWGTPAGSNLIYALGLPEPLRVSPLTIEPFAGPVGGPFGPASLTFNLANGSSVALNWKVSSSSPYFDVTPSSGALLGGGQDVVTVTLKASDTNLGVGVYSMDLLFTNRTDLFVQARSVTLLVAAPPVITSQPADQDVLGEETAQFHVGVATNSQLTYQWWMNTGAATNRLVDTSRISGSTAATLTILNVTNSDAATYFVVVSNAAGIATSSNATLTLKQSPPVIAVAPTNTLVMPGDNAHFAVTVIGTPPFTYQWMFNGTNLLNRGSTVGATSDALTISNVSAGWNGTVTVAIANSLGSTNASANLSVVKVTAHGASLLLLSSFSGGSIGQNPVGGLMTNNGFPVVFYGTTLYGDSAGVGGVYRMSTTGALVPVLSFLGAPSLAYPVAGLTFDKSGFLYGISAEGGADNLGAIFRLSTSGQASATVLRSLSGVDGDLPEANLFEGKDGAFYGTSLFGGTYGMGNAFRITSGGSFANLVTFDSVNGAAPLGTLIEDVNSNLFGTTEQGGFYNLGSVFMITPSGQLRQWVSFDGQDGSGPTAGLTLDALGNLWGTTHDGGLYSGGEVFVFSPDGSGQVVYEFGGVAGDGLNPYASLVLGPDGNLYGSTEGGGQFGLGTIFEISPDGNLTTLASFDGFQGNDPAGALLPYQGSWYGVTFAGGVDDLGAVFKFTASGPLKITGQPANQLVDLGGAGLFQVATYGAGPVTYQWRMDGTNLVDGAGVSGSLARILTVANASPSSVGVYSVVVSNSYGALTSSPAALQLLISTPVITQQPADESVLVGATAMLSVQAVGDYPLTYQWMMNGQPLTDNSRISGATSASLMIRQAAESDSGVYSVLISDDLFYTQSANATLAVMPIVADGFAFQTLHSFGGVTDGSLPYASLIQARDGKLYGATTQGGAVAAGTIFDIGTNSPLTTLYVFAGANDGALPFAGLVQGIGSDANIYGAAAQGGSASDGTLFRLTANHQFHPLYSFIGAPDGNAPEGTLIIGPDGLLYGTTAIGGDFDAGTVFASTTGGSENPIYSFTGFDDGYEPLSGVTLGSDGSFYGTTYLGGATDEGTLYKIDTNGNFTLLHTFSGNDGADPVASLTEGADGRFYGTTFTGGTLGFGVIFSVSTNGDFTNLFTFNYDNGAFLNAGLVPAGNGAFIGAVQNGGPGGAGGIFEITTNGVWTPIIWFTGPNGAAPLNAPTLASDGYFYGTTYFGGVSNVGTIYRFRVPALPQITAQPADVVVAPGASASFSVTATSATPLTYQWFFDGVAIPLATNSSYSLASVSNTNVGSYFVSLSNAGGVTNSRSALLSIAIPVLDNGGFETGDFTSWTLSGNSQNFTVQSGPSIAHSGNFGARLAASNSLGYLTASAATTNAGSYRLSLWLDSPDGLGPNEFSVLWNGGIIFDQTNLPATGWTNLQFVVSASNAVSSVSIGARDDSSFLAVDDVTLTLVPALQTTTVTQTPGQPPQITFDWTASAGLQYQVQYKTSLLDSAWIDLGPPVVAGAGGLAVTDFLTNSQRFYRIVVLP